MENHIDKVTLAYKKLAKKSTRKGNEKCYIGRLYGVFSARYGRAFVLFTRKLG